MDVIMGDIPLGVFKESISEEEWVAEWVGLVWFNVGLTPQQKPGSYWGCDDDDDDDDDDEMWVSLVEEPGAPGEYHRPRVKQLSGSVYPLLPSLGREHARFSAY